MFAITRAQREALFRVFQRDFPSWITPTTRHDGTYCRHCKRWSGDPTIVKVPSLQWRRFRKSVGYYDGRCVVLPWKGMVLGIETDGYVHS